MRPIRFNNFCLSLLVCDMAILYPSMLRRRRARYHLFTGGRVCAVSGRRRAASGKTSSARRRETQVRSGKPDSPTTFAAVAANILHRNSHLRTPALIAGALLDKLIEKILWNQRERHRTRRLLGRNVVKIVDMDSTRFNNSRFLSC
jgi:hypothetical protein